MARIKDRTRQLAKGTAPAKPSGKKIFRTATYARLSVDSRHTQSDSIKFQQILMRDYLKDREEFCLVREYKDDGISGTRFDRREFDSMLAEVRKGNIDCIIVKDFSRFGRNHTEVGSYLEKIFPFLGVRFISVNDGYDSFDRECADKKLAVILKNLVNEYIAGDISVKAASSYAAKQERGEYDGGRAPYGYAFSDIRKTEFVIDEEPAGIVRDIFAWTLRGDSASAIVKRLTERNINPPKAYHDTGAFFRKENEGCCWNEPEVKAILQNMAYAGYMALHKGKVSKADAARSCKLEKSEWKIKENTHEPVISESDFRLVQEILRARKARYESRCAIDERIIRPESPLKGKVFCGDCHVPAARMGTNYKRKKGETYGSVRIYRYRCRTYRDRGKTACTSKSVSEKNLEKLVRQAVMLCVGQAKYREKGLSGLYSEFIGAAKRKTEKERSAEEAALCRRKNEIILLYQEYRKRERFHAGSTAGGGKERYLAEKQKKEEAVRCHEKRITQLEKQLAILESMEKEPPKRQWNPKAFSLFVDKIFLYDGKKVEVVLSFKDERPFQVRDRK